MTQRSFPRHLFGLAAIGALLLGGCDVLDDPVIPLTINYRGDAAPPSFDAMSTGPQHVLLEDFTAHQCGNCPPAGALAEQIAEDNDGRVHLLAIHAGPLAAVSSAPFDTDWTNTEANAYWDQLAAQVNPIGRINRRGGPEEIASPNNWPALVEAELALTPDAHLQGAVIPDPTVSGDVHLHTHITFANAVPGDVRLALLINENHLIAAQLDYQSDPQVIEDFEHNHLLRGSLSGADGLVVASNPAADVW
ncbi:MAG: Omp28-related outer membrane protein [Flavobacteriales bacterium]